METQHYFYAFSFSDEIMGTESLLDYSRLHLGSLPASDPFNSLAIPDFKGHMQQLEFNGVPYVEKVQNYQHNTWLLLILSNMTNYYN